MTKAMLTERLRAYDRLWGRITLVVVATVVLFAFAGVAVLPLVAVPPAAAPDGSEKWRALTLPLAISGASMLLLALTIWCGRWTARRSGLLCPSCGVPLTGRHRRAALGAGRCGRCHTLIVEDAPASLVGVVLPTRNDFLTRLGEYQAAYRRQGTWHVNAILLCFLPCMLLPWLFHAFVEPALRPAGLLPLAGLMFIAVLVSPFFVYLYFLIRWERRLNRSYGLACPWCGASLTGANGKHAAAAGRCRACGQPIWTEAA